MAASVKKNYLYSIAYQILVILTPLITTPYITRILGDQDLGAYSWTQSVCTYFTLIASLGVSMYGQREIAYHQGDRREQSAILSELLLLRAAAVVCSLFPYYLFFVRGDRYQQLFLVQVLDLAALLFDVSWFLQGMENFKLVVGRNAAVKAISVVCIFVFVRSSDDILIYAFCQSAAVLIGNIGLWFYLPRYYQPVPFRELRILRHLRPTLYLFLPQIAIQVYAVMDKFMLGSLASDIAETAYYNQGQKIIKVSQAVITAMGTVMLPRVSYLYKHESMEKVQEVIRRAFCFAMMMGCAMTFGILGTAASLVPWFFGKEFADVKWVLYGLAPTIFLISLSNVSGIQCLVPMKRQREFNISVITGAAVNLIINTLLIPRMGAMGACIGTIAAEFSVTAIQLFALRGLISPVWLMANGWRSLLAGAVMGSVLYFLSGKLPARPLVTLGEIAGGAAVYFILLLLLRDRYVRVLIKETEEIFKRKVLHRNGKVS